MLKTIKFVLSFILFVSFAALLNINNASAKTISTLDRDLKIQKVNYSCSGGTCSFKTNKQILKVKASGKKSKEVVKVLKQKKNTTLYFLLTKKNGKYRFDKIYTTKNGKFTKVGGDLFEKGMIMNPNKIHYDVNVDGDGFISYYDWMMFYMRETNSLGAAG